MLRNESGLSVGWCVGMVPPHPLSATLIVKGTFLLRHEGTAERAPTQKGLTGDLHQEGSPSPPLHYAGDFAWFKPRADLMLVGTCHAPGGHPTTACFVTFQVGSWFKRLAVVGDRFRAPRFFFFWAPSEPLPFRTQPLSYRRSFGGTGYPKNPAGRGYTEEELPDGTRIWPLPNVYPIDRLCIDPDSRPDPAGFGPLSLTTPQRLHKSGTYNRNWLKTRWPGFPQDCDWSLFNAAPPDQQLPNYLRGDERILLENLHPRIPLYTSRLPGLRLRWFLRDTGRLREVPLRLDTLWIDMDTEELVLLWRGTTEIRHRKMREISEHHVVAESLSETPRPAESYARVSPVEAPSTPPAASPSEAIVPSPIADRLTAAYAVLQEKVPELAARIGPPPTFPWSAPRPVWTRETVQAHAEEDGDFSEQDLSGLDLSGLRLAGAVFTGADLHHARLASSDCTGAVLTGANLTGAVLEKALVREADLTGARLTGANLEGATLEGADLTDAEAAGARFSGALAMQAAFHRTNLSGADLSRADLSGADLQEANLEKADLAGATLRGALAAKVRASEATLDGADLAGFQAVLGADFSRSRLREVRGNKSVWEQANLEGADFSRAVLPGANFSEVRARGCTFSRADLRNARLSEAHLEGADFSKANLFRADLEGACLDGARCLATNFFEAELWNASTKETRLEAANLTGTKLESR